MMHRNYSWSERAYKTLAAIVAVAGIATATQGCGTRHIYRNPGKHYVIKSENRVAAEEAEEAQEAQEARDTPESLATTQSNTQPNLEEKVGGGEESYALVDEETHKQYKALYMEGIEYTQQGVNRSDLGKIAKAEELFQQAHLLNPIRTNSIYMIGFCHYMSAKLATCESDMKKNYTAAIEYLGRGLSVAERNIEAQAKGISLREDSRWERENCIKLLVSIYEALGDQKKVNHYQRMLSALDEFASTE